jgi:predicted nuclease of predicted toxin-antitoxin system
MTTLLVDENIPPPVVAFLRNRGFNVEEVGGFLTPGASDASVMELARRQNRALLAFDRHFANTLLYPPQSHEGVIRIRIHPPLISDILQALDHLLEQFDIRSIRGTLIVLERDGFRVRRAS